MMKYYTTISLMYYIKTSTTIYKKTYYFTIVKQLNKKAILIKI